MSKNSKRYNNRTPQFPFPLEKVPGEEALAAWKRLQETWRAEGCSAVVLGDREDLTNLLEGLKKAGLASSILELAAQIKGSDILTQRREDICVEDELDEDGEDEDLDPEVAEQIEEFLEGEEFQEEMDEFMEQAEAEDGLTSHLDLESGEYKETVFIAKIPTTKAWEIPAYLQMGGWNDCPMPAEHVAILRHWAETYGFEIFGALGDTLECVIAQAPASDESAASLAQEQYAYAPAIVELGLGSVEELAQALREAKTWYFWWE